MIPPVHGKLLQLPDVVRIFQVDHGQDRKRFRSGVDLVEEFGDDAVRLAGTGHRPEQPVVVVEVLQLPGLGVVDGRVVARHLEEK